MSKLCDPNINKDMKRTLTNISEDFNDLEDAEETDKFFIPGNKQERRTAVTFEN